MDREFGGQLGGTHANRFSRSPYQQRFLNSGVADRRDLGSCVVELLTRQLMVDSCFLCTGFWGSWRWICIGSTSLTPVPKLDPKFLTLDLRWIIEMFSAAPPDCPRTGNFRHPGTRGAREGGIHHCTHTLSRCLTCSTAPQATPPGYSHQGNSMRGNALYVLQDKQGTRVKRREGGGVEEERSWATLGDPPPLWAPSVGKL